jgi:FtsP/CotA-like multicopper oxidase with cupredoxin domain
MTQPPNELRNPLWIIAIGMACFFGAAGAVMAAPPGPAPTPTAATLLRASQDDAEWLLPARTYAGNRYTPLTQIDKANVSSLTMESRAEVEFTASNPGRTLFHCHQQNHMDLGFMMLFDYV